MGATLTNISIKVKDQMISKVCKYIPTEDEQNEMELAATHGIVNGYLLDIIERGEYVFQLSNGENYNKTDSNVIWVRLYEIDYNSVKFPTW